MLAGNRVEKIPDNTTAEPGLLPVVHLHHALPVGGHFG